jgi:chemotaxis protein MotB
VVQDGDLIRIRISADQLFGQGTAQLISSGSYLLDQVATSISSQYGRQRVAIEGHTDTGPLYGGAYANPSQLAGAQAQAVIDQLVRRNNLPAQQLFMVAHGPNHPIGDNQTAAGRADNRRIEIVIYPDTF